MEKTMKIIASTLVLAALLGTIPASARNICLDTREIVSSKSKDGHTMVFQMRDGTILVNHLQGICPNLKFNGFVWNLPTGATQACEHETTIGVLQSGGQICTLGAFDPPVPRRASR
jgi:hypothetical protein